MVVIYGLEIEVVAGDIGDNAPELWLWCTSRGACKTCFWDSGR